MIKSEEDGPKMTVCLVRHGKAGQAGEDSQRALTDRGREEAAWAGKLLARLDCRIMTICTSPHLRARETAEIISRSLGGVKVEVLPELAPGAAVDRILGVIEPRRDAGALCLVGHMPDMGELAAYMSWGKPGRVMDLATGGIVLAEISGRGEGRDFQVMSVLSPEDSG